MKRFDSRRLRAPLGALVALGAAYLIGAANTAEAVCVGDCDNDGRVRINEVQRCVNLAHQLASEPCANADQDHDGAVSEDEVDRCVQSFLDASTCPQVAGTRTPTRPPATNTPPPATNTPRPSTSTPGTPGRRTSTPTRTYTNTREPTVARTNTPPLPTSTRTNTRPLPTSTRTPTTSQTPTVTPTATNTQTPTNTAVPTNTAPSNPGGLCTIGAGSQSQIILYTALPLPALSATGQLDIECGDLNPATGTRPCNCGVVNFGPLNIANLFWACIRPATAPCPAREVDCDGGDPLSLNLTANRNIGACTSNAACQAQCVTKCGGADKVFQSGCEGFCTQGTQSACNKDLDCLNLDEGSCNGADNAFREFCDCTCLDDAVPPPSGAGDLQCQLAFNLTVESIPGNGLPCDGADITIKVGDTCAPLTTEGVSGIFNKANNDVTKTLPPSGPFTRTDGTALSCAALESRNLSGLKLRGAAAFYASTIGDILTGLVVNCQ